MNLIMTGAAGFIGRKLATALLERGYLVGADGRKQAISRMTLLDVAEPEEIPEDERVVVRTCDISDAGRVQELVGHTTEGIFHLAAVGHSEAEENFDLGMRVNIDGTRNLLEACRRCADPVRFVFASSSAVFEGELPPVVHDTFHLSPQSSYGIQKAVGEFLVQDYTRKGMIEGRSLRLPTVVIRPRRGNRGAGAFVSSILRDTLRGGPAVCPVDDDARIYIASPRRVVDDLIHGFELSPEVIGATTSFMLPGISVSVGDMVESLEKLGGRVAVGRIEWKPNERTKRIVNGWPEDFAPDRALKLGFKADESMDSILEAFITDEVEKETR